MGKNWWKKVKKSRKSNGNAVSSSGTNSAPPSDTAVASGKTQQDELDELDDGDHVNRSAATALHSTDTTMNAIHPPTKSAYTSKNSTGSERYPYPTDYNDHFETPLRAYLDVLPLLDYVMCRKQKQHTQPRKSPQKSLASGSKIMVLYDPYFCTGRAFTLLNETFQQSKNKLRPNTRIQHEKRDFYQDVNKNTIPQHNIFITNPPYSSNHKERCLEFAVKQLKAHARPFFLLMPNYVAMKEYFRKIVLDEDGNNGKKIQCVYVTPSSNYPYEYDHPDGTGHEVSPFASVWFCGLSYGPDGTIMQEVRDAFDKFHYSQSNRTYGVPRMASNLQELIRIGGVSGEKRKNPRQRKKMRQQAMQRTNNEDSVGGGAEKGIKKMQSNDKFKSTNKKRPNNQNSDRPDKKKRV